MIEKSIGKDIENLAERKQFIEDNAMASEKISYTRQLSKDELEELSRNLVENNIDIRNLKEEKKIILRQYTDKQKNLEDTQAVIIDKLKNKSEFVSQEECYKFPDYETRRMAFYNKLGDLVYERAMKPEETQMTMFLMKTGTED